MAPPTKSGNVPEQDTTHLNCTHIEIKLKQNSFKQL